MNAVELGGMKVKQNNDDKDMAGMGKNPALKVWRPIYFLPQPILVLLLLITVTAQFWLHVNFGLQLHGRHHLRRLSDVRP